MVRIGYGTMPEISFSLNADFNYKDFYLNMLWQGVTHCDYMLGGNDQYQWVVGTMLNTAFDQNGNGVKYVAENSWTPENTNAKYPRLTTSSGGNNILISDFWMVNGEYLRLKNLITFSCINEYGPPFPSKPIRFAGTWQQYSSNAIPHENRITAYNGQFADIPVD